MNIQRIKNLAKSIKAKQFSKEFSRKSGQQQLESITEKLKEIQQKHDSLLTDSLSLVDLLDLIINQNSQEYDILAEELERERHDRKTQTKQLQDNIEFSDQKLYELRKIVSEKEEENAYLKAQIEQRDNQISQMEIQHRQKIGSIFQNYNKKLSEQFAQQRKQYENKIILMKMDLSEQIKKYEEANIILLNKNELLSDRLEQIMNYVKSVEEQQQNIEDQLSPRMICNFSPKSTHKSEEMQNFSMSSSPNKSAENLIKQSYLSSGSVSNKGNILRQILNTEDRKSNNFGGSFYSKQKAYLLVSNDENNMNTLNMASKTQQKPIQNAPIPLRKIQEFNAGQGNHLWLSPYYTFFTIICQCAKINSDNLEIAAAMDLSGQWSHFTQNKVPLHHWYYQIQRKISRQINKLT